MAQLKPRNHRWPNPRRTADGEQAPLQPLFSARVEPEIGEKVDRWIKKAGWTKRQLAEYALEEVIDKIDPDEARRMRDKAQQSLTPV